MIIPDLNLREIRQYDKDRWIELLNARIDCYTSGDIDSYYHLKILTDDLL